VTLHTQQALAKPRTSLEDMYKVEVSPALISTLTDAAHPQADTAIGKDRNEGRAVLPEGKCPDAIAHFGVAEGVGPKDSGPSFWRYRCFLAQDQALDAGILLAKHDSLYGSFSSEKLRKIRKSAHQTVRQGGKAALIGRWLQETTETRRAR
jgi:hypothetical protein